MMNDRDERGPETNTYEEWLAWRERATFDEWCEDYKAGRLREKQLAAQRAVKLAMADTIHDHPVWMRLMCDEEYCKQIEHLWRERWQRGGGRGRSIYTDEELLDLAIAHEQKDVREQRLTSDFWRRCSTAEVWRSRYAR